jgi:hypothetical protein
MRRTCTAPGCLTHPALCEGARCPDFRDGGKVYIPSRHPCMYGNRCKDVDPALLTREAPEASENERENGSDLGSFHSEDGGNRRRISKNCLPGACNTGNTGLVMQ